MLTQSRRRVRSVLSKAPYGQRQIALGKHRTLTRSSGLAWLGWQKTEDGGRVYEGIRYNWSSREVPAWV